MQPPRCVDGGAERTLHPQRAVGAAEHRERAFAAVGERQLDAVMGGGPAGVGDCTRHVVRGGGSAELVDRRQDPHGF